MTKYNEGTALKRHDLKIRRPEKSGYHAQPIKNYEKKGLAQRRNLIYGIRIIIRNINGAVF